MGLFGPWCSGPKALPDCRGPQHRRERTYADSPNMKVERISTLYKCPLCSRYVRARLRANGCLQVSLTPKFVQRRRVVEVCSKYVDARSTSTAGVDAGCTRSTAVCFAWSHDLYRSATVTFTVYLWLKYLSASLRISNFHRRRQAQVGRKAFRFVKRASHTTKTIP